MEAPHHDGVSRGYRPALFSLDHWWEVLLLCQRVFRTSVGGTTYPLRSYYAGCWHIPTAGFIASTIVNCRGEGMFLDMTLGIIGAILDGDDDRSWRYRVSGFNLYSLLVAIGGSALVLVSLLFYMPFILHTVRGS